MKIQKLFQQSKHLELQNHPILIWYLRKTHHWFPYLIKQWLLCFKMDSMKEQIWNGKELKSEVICQNILMTLIFCTWLYPYFILIGSGVVDLLILTPGQVFLIFAIFCFFLCTALFWLILEWCYNILNKNTTIDIEIWKKGKNFRYDNFDQKAMERIQWQTKEELSKEQLQAIHYDPTITIDNYNKVR